MASFLPDIPSPRPRLLYCTCFVWAACLGGGFVAPFLQDQAGLSEGLVGTALASQWLIMAFTGSMGGTLADRLENSYPGAGRATVIQVGVAMALCAIWHTACIWPLGRIRPHFRFFRVSRGI